MFYLHFVYFDDKTRKYIEIIENSKDVLFLKNKAMGLKRQHKIATWDIRENIGVYPRLVGM